MHTLSSFIDKPWLRQLHWALREPIFLSLDCSRVKKVYKYNHNGAGKYQRRLGV